MNYEKIIIPEFFVWYVPFSFLSSSETLQETGAHNCWIGVFPNVAFVQANYDSKEVFLFQTYCACLSFRYFLHRCSSDDV
jgi:hypothetical protein